MVALDPKSKDEVTLFISNDIQDEKFREEIVADGWHTANFPQDFPKNGECPPPGIYLLHENTFLSEFTGLLDRLFLIPQHHPIVVVGSRINQEYLVDLFGKRPFFHLPEIDRFKKLHKCLKSAFNALEKGAIKEDYERKLERMNYEIGELHSIGIALSAEKDPTKLLELILTKSRVITQADAGSLFLNESNTRLKLKLSQNDTLDWQTSGDVPIAIDDKSIAGYVAMTGQSLDILDVYLIPKSFPYSFNLSFDNQSGYRSRSMLVVPIKNQEGEVLGIIELINKRKDFVTRKPGEPLKNENIIPFTKKDRDLLSSLASQAAISIENNRLIHDIQRLFEGFVKASVTAIEARDPTTSGHSERVAAMTVALAETVGKLDEGPYGYLSFNKTTLTEIRYASLLHDFGKVGVREEILVKAKKLFPWELDALQSRLAYIRKSMEADFYRKSLDYAVKYGLERYLAIQKSFEANFKTSLDELEEILDFLTSANEPTILEEGNFQRLLEIAQRRFIDTDGREINLLTDREAHVLSIRKGSLSEAERLEIESHVTHTFNFLSKIPWTRDLNRVPEIALAHHEKLNGRGYPNHLAAESIPMESRLLTICDIYDALTAQDRPYKRAIPHQKAFDIMHNEVKQGLLDSYLLETFIGAKIYKVIETPLFNEGRNLRS